MSADISKLLSVVRYGDEKLLNPFILAKEAGSDPIRYAPFWLQFLTSREVSDQDLIASILGRRSEFQTLSEYRRLPQFDIAFNGEKMTGYAALPAIIHDGVVGRAKLDDGFVWTMIPKECVGAL